MRTALLGLVLLGACAHPGKPALVVRVEGMQASDSGKT
jgi:hypothetical protein